MHFNPLAKFNSDRLYKKRLDTVDRIESFPIQNYLFLKYGDEVNQIGDRWCNFDFQNASIEEILPILECTVGTLYLLFLAFNVSRSCDGTTVAVSAWDKALKDIVTNGDPFQELLTVK